MWLTEMRDRKMHYLKSYKAALLTMVLITMSAFATAGSTKADNTHAFLSIADLHFDPFGTCIPTVIPCPIITKLQHAPVAEWTSIFKAYDTLLPQYKSETNYTLLQSTLSGFKQAANEQQAHFALVLGDFLAHHFQEKFEQYAEQPNDKAYQSFVQKTMQFLNTELVTALPSLDIYSVVGNNDSYSGDNVTDPNGVFFQEMAVLWSHAIHTIVNQTAMQKSFPAMGYYAVDLPNQPAIRLIVLNTTPFWQGIHDARVDKAVKIELHWLHQELVTLQAKHQKAIIALHTPAGIDVFASLQSHPFQVIEIWKPAYTQSFLKDMQQFSSQIMVILPAHFHADWFQLVREGSTSIPVSATPAVSPIYSNNPAFKVYRYSQQRLLVVDYVTYFYPLNPSANAWLKEYEFNAIYQPQCQDCRLSDGMTLPLQANTLVADYKIGYTAGTAAMPIAKEENWQYYWCQTQAITAAEYKLCLLRAHSLFQSKRGT